MRNTGQAKTHLCAWQLRNLAKNSLNHPMWLFIIIGVHFLNCTSNKFQDLANTEDSLPKSFPKTQRNSLISFHLYSYFPYCRYSYFFVLPVLCLHRAFRCSGVSYFKLNCGCATSRSVKLLFSVWLGIIVTHIIYGSFFLSGLIKRDLKR